MKITVAYLPEEEREASAALDALCRQHPAAKIRKSENHPPFKHIYFATGKPPISCASKKSVVK